MSKLLSRYAEAVFWMARYVERAENLARILDVQETFSRDSRGASNWAATLDLYADREHFAERYGEATARNVIRFYVLDQDNVSSILSCVRTARENARTLRPLISTEMWVQLNTFYNRLRSLGDEEASEPRLVRLCSMIKEACQTHTGITEGTFYRDEGWHFYLLGRQVERADQTTRLVDVKYHQILPRDADVGSTVDVSQWNALLRSASGFHAYRRVHPTGMSPARVAGFLLFNRHFPRSVVACVETIERTLTDLRHMYYLQSGNAAMEQIDELRAELTGHTIDEVVRLGLHEHLDWIQLKLIDFAETLGTSFFGHLPAEPAQAEARTGTES